MDEQVVPGFTSVTHDGMTVTSSSATEAEMNAAFEPEEAVLAAEPVAEEPKAVEPPKVDKRTKEGRQQSIQAEIDAATAQKHQTRRELDAERAELARIRAERAAFDAPKPQAQPSTVSLAQRVQQPDVTKPILPEAEFYAAHPDATLGDYSRYAARYEIATARADEVQQKQFADMSAAQQARGQKFLERMDAATTTDAEFIEHISADVLALRTFDMLKPGEAGGPLNVVAEEVMSSPVAPQLMRHFSDHPDDLQRLSTLPSGMTPRDHAMLIVREMGKLEARLDAATPGPVPKPIASAAKPPFKPVPTSPLTASEDDGSDDESLDKHIQRENAKEQKLFARRGF